MRDKPGIAEKDALLATTTLSFDIAALELFLPLTVGALVVIASSEAAADATQLISLLERHQITVMQATPTTWHLLLEANWTGSPTFENTVRWRGVVVATSAAVAAALRLPLEHVWAD